MLVQQFRAAACYKLEKYHTYIRANYQPTL